MAQMKKILRSVLILKWQSSSNITAHENVVFSSAAVSSVGPRRLPRLTRRPRKSGLGRNINGQVPVTFSFQVKSARGLYQC